MTKYQRKKANSAFDAWWGGEDGSGSGLDALLGDLWNPIVAWIEEAFKRGYEVGLAARSDEGEEKADDITVLAYQHGDGRLEIEE